MGRGQVSGALPKVTASRDRRQRRGRLPGYFRAKPPSSRNRGQARGGPKQNVPQMCRRARGCSSGEGRGGGLEGTRSGGLCRHE